MKVFWVIFYNVIVYPLIFLSGMVLSILKDKIRDSAMGKFSAIRILKNYFNQNGYNPNTYWFHASSLGEYYQIKPVLEGLKNIEPESRFLVSFTSPSGYNNAYSDAIDLKFYMPFDFPWSVSSALDIVRPKKVIFSSYDYWPNFIWISKLKGIYTNVFAFRLKVSSLKRIPIIRNFFKNIYKSMSAIYTISDQDRDLLNSVYGKKDMPPIKAMGNPRYDMVIQTAKIYDSYEKPNDYKRIIIGSAHEEEENILIPSLVSLINSYPHLKILYAPHEPNSDEIKRIKNKFKEQGILSTIFTKQNDLALPNDQLVIIGVVGVLSKLYWQSSIAYVGGGYSTGIHNVMEPAVAGIPVFFGPKYDHAHEAEELLSSAGGFCIHDGDEFLSKISELIKDDDHLKICGLAAKDVIQRNSGSSEKIISEIVHE